MQYESQLCSTQSHNSHTVAMFPVSRLIAPVPDIPKPYRMLDLATICKVPHEKPDADMIRYCSNKDSELR